jgi:hypothetical protein
VETVPKSAPGPQVSAAHTASRKVLVPGTWMVATPATGARVGWVKNEPPVTQQTSLLVEDCLQGGDSLDWIQLQGGNGSQRTECDTTLQGLWSGNAIWGIGVQLHCSTLALLSKG